MSSGSMFVRFNVISSVWNKRWKKPARTSVQPAYVPSTGVIPHYETLRECCYLFGQQLFLFPAVALLFSLEPGKEIGRLKQHVNRIVFADEYQPEPFFGNPLLAAEGRNSAAFCFELFVQFLSRFVRLVKFAHCFSGTFAFFLRELLAQMYI